MSESTRRILGIPDVPVDPKRRDWGHTDLLGVDKHARALAEFAAECSTPMTIGIQGDWGSGKTSLMNLVEQHLTDSGKYKILHLRFDAWKYSQFGNEEGLGVSMLMTLMRQLVRADSERSSLERATRFIKALVRVMNFDVKGVSLRGDALLAVWEDAGDDAGVFERMKSEFAGIVNGVCGGDGRRKFVERVIIYIDDLDRVAPVRAVELLEIMKIILDVSDCVFLIAIDYNVVERGLAERGLAKGLANEGRLFFDKIIQVPFRMPTEHYKTYEFLMKHYETMHGAPGAIEGSLLERYGKELIDSSVRGNPRSLKRVLNLHALLERLIDTEARADVERFSVLRFSVLVLAAIQVSMPEMYSFISQSDSMVAVAMLAVGVDYEFIVSGGQFEKEKTAAKVGALFQDSTVEQIGEALERIARELRNPAAITREHWLRMHRLAKVLLGGLDELGEEPGKIEEDEIQVLHEALDIARASTSDIGDAEDAMIESNVEKIEKALIGKGFLLSRHLRANVGLSPDEMGKALWYLLKNGRVATEGRRGGKKYKLLDSVG